MSRSTKQLVKRMFAERDDDLGRFLAMRLPSRADAEDLSQETYLRLLRVERSDLIRRPEALLYRIASNLIYEYYLKRSHREKSDTELVEGTASAERPTDARADARRRVARLEKVTATLPPKCRAALIMARRDGMTYAEIAARLGVSTSMVKKYLQQAHALCRKRMKDEHREQKQ